MTNDIWINGAGTPPECWAFFGSATGGIAPAQPPATSFNPFRDVGTALLDLRIEKLDAATAAAMLQ